MFKNFPQLLLILIGFACAVYTQTTALSDVPGLHFDEAWQGLYAYRIAFEPGFFPIQAMNSYTFSIVHYPIALLFKLFWPTLEVMRIFYVACNLLALSLFVFAFLKIKKPLAAFIFTLIWGLLPFFVHTHRFFIEMTGFFSLCMAAAVYALTTFENNRKHRAFLLIAALILGTFSHVLFLAFAIAIFGIASLEGKPSRFITVVYCTALVFILVRMTLDLRKIGPVFLAGGAGITVAFFLAKKETYFSRATLLARPLFEIVAIPFFLLFLFLMWGGPWSYAQATGSLVFWWWPLNIVLLIALYLNSGRWNWTRDSTKFSWERRAWFGFVLSLIACNAMVYKPAPRYFVIPAIFLTIWAALAFDDYWQRSRFQPRARTLLGLSLVFAFIVNLFVFQSDYLNRFLTRPGLDREFRLWHFNDSARDFRPFQRVFSWAEKNGCALTLDWVEDDRFGLPLKFLQLDSKPTGKACPWHKKQLFFSHIPNFNSDLRIAERLRVGESIAHPQYGLRILAHEPEWGDLAIWIRDLP